MMTVYYGWSTGHYQYLNSDAFSHIFRAKEEKTLLEFMTECFLNRWGGQAEEGPCEDRFLKHILNADDALYEK